MFKILVSCLLAMVFADSALAGGMGGGRGMRKGGARLWGMTRDEAKNKVCTAANMVDSKLTLLQEEQAKCHLQLDDCVAKADDLGVKVTEGNRNVLLMAGCSTKYSNCMSERRKAFKNMRQSGGGADGGADGGAGDGATPAGADEDKWHKKMQALKECMKNAFNKAFGA